MNFLQLPKLIHLNTRLEIIWFTDYHYLTYSIIIGIVFVWLEHFNSSCAQKNPLLFWNLQISVSPPRATFNVPSLHSAIFAVEKYYQHRNHTLAVHHSQQHFEFMYCMYDVDQLIAIKLLGTNLTTEKRRCRTYLPNFGAWTAGTESILSNSIVKADSEPRTQVSTSLHCTINLINQRQIL